MKISAAELKAGNAPAVWIELQRSTDPKRNEQSAELANAMLRRLGAPETGYGFEWNEERKCYDFRYSPMAIRSLTDDGEWFGLAEMAGVK